MLRMGVYTCISTGLKPTSPPLWKDLFLSCHMPIFVPQEPFGLCLANSFMFQVLFLKILSSFFLFLFFRFLVHTLLHNIGDIPPPQGGGHVFTKHIPEFLIN
jgi:hypothetical protein